MTNIILWVVGIVSVITTIYVYWDNKKLERIIKNKKFACRYNEQTGCYGICCSICDSKKECNWCCGGDPKCCGGLVEED